MRFLCCIFLLLASREVSRAYNGNYEKGDFWSLEEDFLKNSEGPGFFKQGDFKQDYNADDQVWFYLSVGAGDDLVNAVALPHSGFSPRGAGWASEQAEPDATSDHRIDGYPFIVRGYGALEKQVFTHPGDKQDILIAWQAPVTGSYSVQSAYQRLSQMGDGQKLSWVSANGEVLGEKAAEDSTQPLKLDLAKVVIKKGERIFLRINPKDNFQEDMGAVSIRVTYLGN